MARQLTPDVSTYWRGLLVSTLESAKLIGSMSRIRAAGDNAAMESFLILLQTDILDWQRWTTRWLVRNGGHRRAVGPGGAGGWWWGGIRCSSGVGWLARSRPGGREGLVPVGAGFGLVGWSGGGDLPASGDGL
jgi:transposase InsO family protein